VTAVLSVVLLSLTFVPLRSEADALWRWQIAAAIVEGTDDAREHGILVRLAYYEAGFQRRVASCAVLGDAGRAHGLFQVQPITPSERRAACGPLRAQVALALERVRQSMAACAHLEPRDQLSGYTRGRCTAGERKARERWGTP
jgi:hypothetical protein